MDMALTPVVLFVITEEVPVTRGLLTGAELKMAVDGVMAVESDV
jgi:hypothetical protein